MDNPINIMHDLLARAIRQARDAVIMVDARQPGFPVIYVNQGFEKLTGYSAAEMLGKSYRILLGNDMDQPEIDVLRAAIANGQGCTVPLRSYHKDGSMFWSELSISPVHGLTGELTHYLGIQNEVTARMLSEQRQQQIDRNEVTARALLEQHLRQSKMELQKLTRRLNDLATADPIAGVNNRRCFDEHFASLFAAAQRTGSSLWLLLIDVDYFTRFNQRYGQAAGDECLRLVGECVAKSFARLSDCAARYARDEFAVVALTANVKDLRQHAQRVCEQVRKLNIPNADSEYGIVTVSIGGMHCIPGPDFSGVQLIERVEQELSSAKRDGCNRVYIPA